MIRRRRGLISRVAIAAQLRSQEARLRALEKDQVIERCMESEVAHLDPHVEKALKAAVTGLFLYGDTKGRGIRGTLWEVIEALSPATAEMIAEKDVQAAMQLLDPEDDA